MLKTLKNIETNKALEILSDISMSLLPKPNSDLLEKYTSLFSDLHRSVLREARERLNLSIDDDSILSKTKVLEFVAHEMSENILNPKTIEGAKKRLGQSGDLRPDLYTISYPDHFDTSMGNCGVRRSHIEDAIYHPDKVQHILPERLKNEGFPALSLFTKSIGDINSKNRFTLIVQADRHGYKQDVINAWRVYHSDVAMSSDVPLDILKSFIDKYGLEFQIEDIGVRKFLFYETIPKKENHFNLKIKHEAHDKKQMFASFLVRQKGDTWELAIAYAININKYKEDISAHNVQVVM